MKTKTILKDRRVTMTQKELRGMFDFKGDIRTLILVNEPDKINIKTKTKLENNEGYSENTYIIDGNAILKKANVKGDIEEVGLWRGLSPKEEKEGLSHDIDEYYFEVIEHFEKE